MISFKVTGLDETLKHLAKKHYSLSEYKVWLYLEKLADYGMEWIEAKFLNIPFQQYASVDFSIEGNTLTMWAEGEDVLFIEFGAGDDAHAGAHEWGDELGYVSDAWSSEHKRQYHDNKKWTYIRNNVIYKDVHGRTPHRGMYLASKAVREQVLKTAREVFAND